MEFAHKEITIDGNKFTIKYLTKVEDYELETSKNKIVISVFYHPNKLMSLFDSKNILDLYLDKLREEVLRVINENNDFYSLFESDYTFTQSGSTGGYDDFGREGATNAHAIMYLKKREI